MNYARLEKMVRNLVAGVLSGLILVGLSTVCAPESYADNSSTFGEQNWRRICNQVGQEPTAHGIWAANSILLSQQRVLNYKQMQDAIGYAIQNHCTQYASVYTAYRTQWP